MHSASSVSVYRRKSILTAPLLWHAPWHDLSLSLTPGNWEACHFPPAATRQYRVKTDSA